LDPVQIDEAYSAGASAILLIARILEPMALTALLAHAKGLGLGVLVETHNANEVKTALACGADTIGINTRDLDTFQIHPRLIEEIAPLLSTDITRVAESGIHSFADWQPYIGLVDSMLIGSYFMKAPDIQFAYTKLLAN
jgi:indole-3-glycerol phosphate synthase